VRKISLLTKGGLVTGAALAAALGLAISPASAAGSWTVTGGGPFTADSTNTLLTDNGTGTTLTCTDSTAAGTAANASGVDGDGIASISGVQWTSCSGPLNITFDVTADHTPWALNAVSYSGGVTTGTLSGVEAHISGLTCTASFAGSDASTPATLDVSYDNATHDLKVLGTGDLHAYNVGAGCLGLIGTGDSVSYTGDYIVSPASLQITEP
jgi:hypothetical protein